MTGGPGSGSMEVASPDAQPGRGGWTRCCLLTQKQPTEGQAPPRPIGDNVLIIFVHPPGSGSGGSSRVGRREGVGNGNEHWLWGPGWGGGLTPPRAKGYLPSWGGWGWGWESS